MRIAGGVAGNSLNTYPGGERPNSLGRSASRLLQGWYPTVIPRVFALTLLAAASLKARRLGLERPEPFSLTIHIFWTIIIGIEWILGAWLLSGVAKVQAWQVAIGALLAFVIVSAWRVIAGEHDCHCFGQLHVHPAWTLAIDFFMLAGFFLLRTKYKRRIVGNAHIRTRVSAGLVLACIFSVAVFRAGSLFSGGSERVVFLDTQSWLGRRCPLLDDLRDSADEVSRGSATLILVDRNCEKCQDFLMQLHGRPNVASEIGRTWFTDLSSHGGDALVLWPGRELHLRQTTQYIAELPAEIVLYDGMVVSVHVGEQAELRALKRS